MLLILDFFDLVLFNLSKYFGWNLYKRAVIIRNLYPISDLYILFL